MSPEVCRCVAGWTGNDCSRGTENITWLQSAYVVTHFLSKILMSVEWAHMAVIIFVQTIQEVTHAAVTMGMI